MNENVAATQFWTIVNRVDEKFSLHSVSDSVTGLPVTIAPSKVTTFRLELKRGPFGNDVSAGREHWWKFAFSGSTFPALTFECGLKQDGTPKLNVESLSLAVSYDLENTSGDDIKIVIEELGHVVDVKDSENREFPRLTTTTYTSIETGRPLLCEDTRKPRARITWPVDDRTKRLLHSLASLLFHDLFERSSTGGGQTVCGWDAQRRFHGDKGIFDDLALRRKFRDHVGFERLSARIDMQGQFDRGLNGLTIRYTNVQMQIEDETYAHVEVPVGIVFGFRRVRRALINSIDRGRSVTLQPDEKSNKETDVKRIRRWVATVDDSEALWYWIVHRS